MVLAHGLHYFLLSIEFGGFGIPIIASHASPRNFA